MAVETQYFLLSPFGGEGEVMPKLRPILVFMPFTNEKMHTVCKKTRKIKSQSQQQKIETP